ncbi:ICOS ligand [Nannospalax galili]|uniref:ICOS ligand n=1 Tax=Nannospalax galili TaxID=1026970 RepID=UPI00081A18A1|nr:ICOS ligand [Nannospalax galili]
MPPSLYLVLLLLSGLHAENEIKEVQAMVGSDVALSCIHPNQSHFDLNDLFVYWQISDLGTVVAYYLSENKSDAHEASQYKNRAHMLLDRMKQGDFSLYLQNVTPQDTQKFECLVFWKSTLTRALKKEVRLHVAANFSLPVVHSSNPSQGQELTFTCISTNGYPKPNLYWINRTDNSLMDEALQNSTVSLNERGLYDVISILRIPWALHVNVSCCVENVVLHQNLTSISQGETSIGNKDMFTENPQTRQEEKIMALFSILAVLLVAAVISGWVCRSKCPHRRYTGPRTVVLEHELTDHA